MKRETFQIEFVTPGFLAGAEGRAEWRAASVRGELRWWFRAVAGGAWQGDLDRVRGQEEFLFGSTERKSLLNVRTFGNPAASSQRFGKGLSAAEIARLWKEESPETVQRLTIKKPDGQEILSRPVQYLAFGPVSMEGTRRYFSAEGSGQLEVLWGRGEVDAETRGLFEKAFWAWLNLGGIGAKSRKGFGSLRCKEQPGVSPATIKDFEERAREIWSLGAGFGETPAWTHFSSRARIYAAARPAGSWEEALEWLGAWMIAFRRRYGYSKDSRVFDGVPIASRDYVWAAPNGGKRRQGMPDRAGFGLPLPFKKREQGETVIWGAPAGSPDEEREREQDSRRASPLLLHVSRFGKDFVPVLTYLPADLLPSNGSLRFKGHPRKSFPLGVPQETIIDRFLGDLEAKSLIRKVTP